MLNFKVAGTEDFFMGDRLDFRWRDMLDCNKYRFYLN